MPGGLVEHQDSAKKRFSASRKASGSFAKAGPCRFNSPCRPVLPEGRGGQFEAVAGGVAEVDALGAVGPADLALDLHAVVSQMGAPGFEFVRCGGKGDMAGAGGTVGRHLDGVSVGGRLASGAGVEDEQHALAAAVEEVPIGVLAHEFQAEDLAVESFGGLQVGGIQGGLEQCRRGHGRVGEGG